MYPKLLENIITNPKWFKFFGFTIVRQILLPDEIKYLRKMASSWFKSLNSTGRMLLPRHVLQIKDLYELPLRQNIVNNLKIALGNNYVQWGDFQLQRNCFGGFHTDSGSENMAPYLLKKNYKFVKCGIYLQANSKLYGGGIAIRWFSHKLLYNNLPSPIKIMVHQLYKMLKNFLEHNVRINPGDLVFFDSRLLHASSLPSNVAVDDCDQYGQYHLEEAYAKYAFYWNACAEDSWKEFMINTFKRSYLEEVIPQAKEIFFTDYSSRRYPDEYPKDFVKLVTSHKLGFASPTARQAELSKKLLNEVEC